MTEFRAESAPGEPPPPASVEPKESTPQAPTSVARLNSTIRGAIERWGTVWVEGELTSWNRRTSGVFAGLKDAEVDASIQLSIWSSTLARLPGDLKVGDRVVACVKAGYFGKTGSLTFTVSDMRHVGLGDQLVNLERLRAKLHAEGLFDASRKKPLPFLPRLIGLITGERSDAEKDVHRNAQLRWPQVSFRTEYAAVQGDRCAPEVIAALARLDADPDVDVIIIARGGGDPQQLLGFSDERLLRAVAAASTPVVSAIGHENDRPLLDEVADLRASTPTDAAKRVVPDVAEQRAVVQQLRARMANRLTVRIAHDISQLEQLRTRPVLRAPEALLQGRAQELFLLVSQGRDALRRVTDAGSARVEGLRSALRALSPRATLDRGYAIAHRDGGVIVRDASQAPAGATLTVTVGRGSFAARSEGEVAEQ